MPYKNILLIDDDLDDQEIFQIALTKISKNTYCIAFDNAKSALAKLDSGELLPDVIFLDLNMPVMTGQEFLVEISKKEHLKSIPVIILSTSSHAPTIALTKLLGAVDFITKPDTVDKLIVILEPIIKNHSVL